MASKSSDQIRQDFLDFFKEKQHLIVSSAPVVPKEDPTLLFTNAGMNQFKPIFLGQQEGLEEENRIWHRAADTQRCIRVSGKHNDLEEVGHDTYHHTLFEMLGNWSFGDYFKKEAIAWAWELLVDRWGLDPDRLYATVFEGDETDGTPEDSEAIALWKSETGIKPEQILKFGKKDNFWEMGETGPCGPCSEVHIDLRPQEEREKVDGATLVNMDDPRVMEIWNLVFIQFNRTEGGKLKQLPAQHVDTGMGFERICAILQGKTSNYDSDVFTPLLNEIGTISGFAYGQDERKDIAMRVIADHIRAVAFSIADGASPSNEGRGYVVRRILRRAVRYGWDDLNLKEPFMHKLVAVLAHQFEEVFPVLASNQSYVINVIQAEERSFLKTLGQGIELFEEMVSGEETLSGEDAFKLHDTYGFPIDLTQLMARERGIEVDVERFDELMKQQKERARAAGSFKAESSDADAWQKIHDSEEFTFLGYDQLEAEANITKLRQENDKTAIILDQTPFYAESGGQVADSGILTDGNQHLKVVNVQKSAEGFIHYVEGTPEHPDATWRAIVDGERRQEICKHHSATHLVHAALREELGDHVAQKGSFLNENHLRFDFSHFDAMTAQQLDAVEKRVNERVQANIPLLEERNVPIEQAKERGAMMLFGEKYGEEVRVITFDPEYSVELCGGTHVEATGNIGYFRFLGESSAAAGVRRIEAVTGHRVDRHLREEKHLLEAIRGEMGQSEDLVRDITRLLEEKKELEKEVDRLLMQGSASTLDTLMNQPTRINDAFDLVRGEIKNADMNTLKQLGYDALNKQSEGLVVVLGSRDQAEGKVYLMVAISDDLISEKELKAGAIVGQLGRMVGGGGGGQPNLATAGGRQPEKLEEALAASEEIIRELIS